MRYGYLDEAGGADPYSGSRYLVVAAFATPTVRPVELHVKRAHQALGRAVQADELKASAQNQRVNERLLQSLAEEDISIVAVIVDKRAILRPRKDSEDIYREAVTRTIAHCVSFWPRIELFLDQRYTNKELRHRLERIIREGIAAQHPDVVLIHQEDSRSNKGIQAADHIAWAIFQKYEVANEQFYQILRPRIVAEQVITHHLW